MLLYNKGRGYYVRYLDGVLADLRNLVRVCEAVLLAVAAAGVEDTTAAAAATAPSSPLGSAFDAAASPACDTQVGMRAVAATALYNDDAVAVLP